MPIWRSSDLVTGRVGSPSRRSSARLSVVQAGRSSVSVDGELLGGTSEQPASLRQTGPGGHSHSTSPTHADGALMASLTATPAAIAPLAPVVGSSSISAPAEPTSQQSQTFLRPPSAPRRGASGNLFGISPPTYTVQYVGIANGELGILSQKQRLAPQRPTKTAAGGHGAATSSGSPPLRRHTHAFGASSPSASGSPAAPAASSPTASPRPATAPTVVGRAALPSPHPQSSRSSLSSRPTSCSSRSWSPKRPASALASLPHQQAALSQQPQSPAGSEAPAAAAPPQQQQDAPASQVLAGHGAGDSGGQPEQAPLEAESAAVAPEPAVAAAGAAEPPPTAAPKPPSLTSLVEDATGSVKVVSECFYSRALHSRSGPRDRHARHNRPMGPPAQDKELLNTGLPGRFGSRAPSGGGFPGWKLTTVGAVGAAATGAALGATAGASTGLRAGSARGAGGELEGPGDETGAGAAPGERVGRAQVGGRPGTAGSRGGAVRKAGTSGGPSARV